MAIKNFVKEVRIKFEFLELFQKAFTKIKHFLKTSVNEELDFIKRPKENNTKSSKTACFSRTFSENLHWRP